MKWSIPMVLALLLLPNVSASVSDALEFSSNLLEMKGHLDRAVLLMKQGDRESALAHAEHPVEEYWTVIGGRVKEKDPELFQELDSELAVLPKLAETASAEEFETKIEEVSRLLERAKALVVSEQIRSGFIFKSKLIIAILEDAKAEYGEGISETGEVKMVEEYHDSLAFVERAEEVYQGIRGAVEEKEAREIDEFFEELEEVMKAKQSPAKVETIANGIAVELQEVADISAVKEKGSSGIISNIKALLDKVVEEYKEKEYEEAEEFAVKAYLENYEQIESQVDNADPELNEELEKLMREDLRRLIEDRASDREVEQLVDQIKEKLGRAENLLEEATPQAAEEKSVQVAQPSKEKKPDMAPWYGAIMVLLGISLAEGIAIVKLRRKRE